ncbi:uncharacterized protein LOC124117379 isoform X2 [Haliotis rufescens]|uniref:uncharacterized protein LOC124117379 isoform X2 n=1 Tax=Haliotis rufescens TaxID=6454 RepID=UPI00201F6786|nr:uncharacterized protein LOC124117379 isoform X2 [Haliotis rufescens]
MFFIQMQFIYTAWRVLTLAVWISSTWAWFETGESSGMTSEMFACGGAVMAGTDVVESPGFPEYYPSDLDCLWVIRTAPGWRINMTSQYFDLEDQSQCLWDFLEVKDGDIATESGKARYCGSEHISFLSSSDVITLRFQTDAAGDGIGFRLNFTPVRSDAAEDYCNTTLTGDKGFITSPGYPLAYPPSVLCHYTIQGPPHSFVELRLLYLDVETSPCDFDYVAVHDGPNTDSERLALLCGMTAHGNWTSSGRHLHLVFKSDSAIQTHGFNVSYHVVPLATTTASTTASTTVTELPRGKTCTVTLSDEGGNFTSPKYPDAYPHNSRCVTYIRASNPSTIVIEFIAFDLEESENCTYDTVTLSSAPYGEVNESINHVICGDSVRQRVFTFDTTAVTVTFTSDTSVNAGGYVAHYFVSPLQRESPCPLQCNNGGTCVKEGVNDTSGNTWRCDCTRGFSGEECEYEDDVTCEDYACHNGGTCYIQGRGPRCHCLPRYTGSLCTTQLMLESERVTFTKVPHNITIARGSSVLLECAVQEGDVGIMWLHRDRILSEGDHTEGIEVHPGGVLHVPEVSDDQDGKYTCVALSGGNLFEMSSWVSLTEPCRLRVEKAPQNMTVEEGGIAILQCFVPDAEHTMWRKNGEIIKFDRRKKILVNNYLVLDQIVETDAGEYTCAARASNGCSARVSATLTIDGIGHKKACGRPKVVKEAGRGGRIASGKEVLEGESPWHVIIRDKRHTAAFCGGSLINTQWFLTAAHCVEQFEKSYRTPFSKEDVDIYVGTVRCDGKQGIQRRLKHYILHPEFKGHNFDNDVALFQLDQPVEFSDLVMPICLERELLVNELLRGGRVGMITGCGSLYEYGMSPTFLREVSIPYVNRPVCERSAKSVNTSFTSGMICAGYSRRMRGDACHGDSGGPYVMEYGGRWIQVGIVSWGVGCDQENQYGYYTHVSRYYDWILDNSIESEVEDFEMEN